MLGTETETEGCPVSSQDLSTRTFYNMLRTSLLAGDKITCKPPEIKLSVGATGQFLQPDDGNKVSKTHATQATFALKNGI